MNWLLLEALGAGAVLIAIVWWTMFSGRRGGERVIDQDEGEARAPEDRADSAMPSADQGRRGPG